MRPISHPHLVQASLQPTFELLEDRALISGSLATKANGSGTVVDLTSIVGEYHGVLQFGQVPTVIGNNGSGSNGSGSSGSGSSGSGSSGSGSNSGSGSGSSSSGSSGSNSGSGSNTGGTGTSDSNAAFSDRVVLQLQSTGADGVVTGTMTTKQLGSY